MNDFWEELPASRKRAVLIVAVALVIAGVLGIGWMQIRATSSENYHLGLEALGAEDYSTAVRRFEAVAGRFGAPQRAAAGFYAARSYEGLGEYGKAAAGYARYLSANPRDPFLAPQAAMALLRVREAAGDTAAAQVAAREALERYGAGPLGPQIRLEAARLAISTGETGLVAEILAPVLALEGSDTEPAAALVPYARGLLAVAQEKR